jgi:hypothetical protein
MKSFTEFKLNEIGDRIKTPHQIKKSSLTRPIDGGKTGKTFFYDFQIGDDPYQVVIQIISNSQGDSALKIDFGRIVEDEISVEMTNKNNMLEVMSNLVGVVKEWLQEYPGNERIVSIVIGSKLEYQGDFRRPNIYDSIMKKNVNKFGVKIREVLDITPEFKKEFPQYNNIKFFKYRIEPTNLNQMRKAIQNQI